MALRQQADRSGGGDKGRESVAGLAVTWLKSARSRLVGSGKMAVLLAVSPSPCRAGVVVPERKDSGKGQELRGRRAATGGNRTYHGESQTMA